jgi:hypothetical protein
MYQEGLNVFTSLIPLAPKRRNKMENCWNKQVKTIKVHEFMEFTLLSDKKVLIRTKDISAIYECKTCSFLEFSNDRKGLSVKELYEDIKRSY